MYKNLTFGIDKLFKWSVFIINYTGALRDIFKRIFDYLELPINVY